MVNQERVEALYDCLDESAILLYKTYKLPYIEAVVKTCENIIANSVEDEYYNIKDDLEASIAKIADVEFSKEEIRKAFQYACLKGFKHANISNEMITPETIGVFVNYLISQLYVKENLRILDPLVGTGNLLAIIANSLSGKNEIIGVDDDLDAYKLSSALFDMLDFGEQVYYQDTKSFVIHPIDLIVSDFSGIKEEDVYSIIGHHSKNVQEGGFLVGIFDLDVVRDDVLVRQAKVLNKLWKLFGYIKLPDNISKNSKKVIVIFQRDGKQVIQPKQFLLVELPDFTNAKAFKKVINQLNSWFKNTDFYKLGV